MLWKKTIRLSYDIDISSDHSDTENSDEENFTEEN